MNYNCLLVYKIVFCILYIMIMNIDNKVGREGFEELYFLKCVFFFFVFDFRFIYIGRRGGKLRRWIGID